MNLRKPRYKLEDRVNRLDEDCADSLSKGEEGVCVFMVGGCVFMVGGCVFMVGGCVLG